VVTIDAERRALADFCADLPRLRLLSRAPTARNRMAALEQAVAAARRGERVLVLLEQLYPRQAPSGEDGDDTRGAVLPLPPDVTSASAPVTGGYRCPAGACDRWETRTAGASPPQCDIHEQALRFRADG
jgi:hypothetical protein